jgi:hypothetical protein
MVIGPFSELLDPPPLVLLDPLGVLVPAEAAPEPDELSPEDPHPATRTRPAMSPVIAPSLGYLRLLR